MRLSVTSTNYMLGTKLSILYSSKRKDTQKTKTEAFSEKCSGTTGMVS